MTKLIASIFSLTSVALVATVGTASAEGDYYEGAIKAAPRVDSVTTGSINGRSIEFNYAQAKQPALVRQPTSRDNREIGDE